MRSEGRLAEISLILGGARSGKSRLGERLCCGQGQNRIYIATAQAFDEEMRQRIDAHQARRNHTWRTIEAPMDLAQAIAEAGQIGLPILVDCLTLWLSNHLLADGDIDHEVTALLEAVQAVTCPITLISNEVGLSIVPENDLARKFRDLSGCMNQRAAMIADNVIFTAAGLPLILKGQLTEDVAR